MLGSTSTVANCLVKNNFIVDVASYGFAGSGVDDNGNGIVVNTGAGYSIYNNTVNLNTNQTLATSISSSLLITTGVITAGAINLRNNIFTNSQTLAGTERNAIRCMAPSTVLSAIDYNDYFSAGPNVGFLVSNLSNLSAIQTAFGGNVNSLNIQPVFVSATDLHLSTSANATLDNTGVIIGTVTTDIDGNTRSVTPDMGADEFTFFGYCPGANVGYVSNISGATYQWQVDNGSGYVNVVDGAVYGGSATNTLLLTAPPTSYNRYKYRCLVDGAMLSNVSTYKVGVSWTGSVSTDWLVAGNWNCGAVPDQYTDVQINAAATNYPVVASVVTIRSLLVNAAAAITVNTGFTIVLTGL